MTDSYDQLLDDLGYIINFLGYNNSSLGAAAPILQPWLYSCGTQLLGETKANEIDTCWFQVILLYVLNTY